MVGPLPPYANSTRTMPLNTMPMNTMASTKVIVVHPTAEPKFANTTITKKVMPLTTQGSSNVTIVHPAYGAPYANKTRIEHPTTLMNGVPLSTNGASVPSNSTGECTTPVRCPDLTRVGSGCVFGSYIISQHTVTEYAHAPALCKLRLN